MIARRSSPALRAQRTLLLDGTGIRSGTRGTLLRSSPPYANLVDQRNSVA